MTSRTKPDNFKAPPRRYKSGPSFDSYVARDFDDVAIAIGQRKVRDQIRREAAYANRRKVRITLVKVDLPVFPD